MMLLRISVKISITDSIAVYDRGETEKIDSSNVDKVLQGNPKLRSFPVPNGV